MNSCPLNVIENFHVAMRAAGLDYAGRLAPMTQRRRLAKQTAGYRIFTSRGTS